MKNKFDYAIICAMKEESEMVINEFGLEKIENEYFPIFIKDNILLLESNMGKVAATFAITYLLDNFNVKNIINIGLAGALNVNFEPAQSFCVKEVFQHDVYMPIDHYKKDMYQKIECSVPINNMNINSVVLATGDQFIDDKSSSMNKFLDSVDLVDMEGFSIAYVASKYKRKVIMIKSVSDKSDGSAKEHLFENLFNAMKNGVSLLKNLIKMDL